MDYRDERDALRARIESLEGALASAQAEAERMRATEVALDAARREVMLLRSELEVAARALHRAMGLRAATLSIYGELFGGAYPHSEVAAVPGMAPVQTGIWRWPFHGRCKASPRNKKRG